MTTAQHDLAAIRGIMADIDAEHDLSPAELWAGLSLVGRKQKSGASNGW
jgi:hypothetical protein